jgi:hypothetical protein
MAYLKLAVCVVMKSGKKLHYVRQVPKFLRGYAHLLQSDKKNYLGEEVGYDEVTTAGFQTEQDLEEDGAVIVRTEERKFLSRVARVENNEGDDVKDEDEEEEELTEVPSVSDFFPEVREEEAAERRRKDALEEIKREESYYKDGKILFHGKSTKKRRGEVHAGGDIDGSPVSPDTTVGTGERKKQKVKPKKKLLSFDEEEV